MVSWRKWAVALGRGRPGPVALLQALGVGAGRTGERVNCPGGRGT